MESIASTVRSDQALPIGPATGVMLISHDGTCGITMNMQVSSRSTKLGQDSCAKVTTPMTLFDSSQHTWRERLLMQLILQQLVHKPCTMQVDRPGDGYDCHM